MAELDSKYKSKSYQQQPPNPWLYQPPVAYSVTVDGAPLNVSPIIRVEARSITHPGGTVECSIDLLTK